MCSSHRPLEGADSEPLSAVDSRCDHCSRITSRLYRYPLSGGRNFLCAECAVRESGQPVCAHCERPTFGDYRLIQFDREPGPTVVCGVCMDKYAGAVA